MKIRNNISVNAWDDFVACSHEIKYVGAIDSFRHDILRTMQQLESVGEIVIGWEPGYPGIRRGEQILFPGPRLPYQIRERPVDPEVKAWLDTVLHEAGRSPRIRPSDEGQIEV